MKKRAQHHIDGLLALLLFGVFASCLLAVLLGGAGAYRRLTDRDNTAFTRRTAIQYISARVRQADSDGAVSVEPFGDCTALALTDSAGYVTRVYCLDGHLMELYTSAETELQPEDGEKILAAEALELSLVDGLLTMVLTGDDGVQSRLSLSLRSGEGAAA
ncbi:MAG: DUF4860 domain-containing protein [Oscillospiraceae bacterium]|jgi:hypothetical protein|nr:DUF4860 domain-containing protein [Oscillospiraceae bacterium]